jgi:hypothetical protein
MRRSPWLTLAHPAREVRVSVKVGSERILVLLCRQHSYRCSHFTTLLTEIPPLQRLVKELVLLIPAQRIKEVILCQVSAGADVPDCSFLATPIEPIQRKVQLRGRALSYR